jgi:hypothetical protein
MKKELKDRIKLVDSGIGGSLQETISIGYDELCELLGEPNDDDGSGDGKIDVEWILEFDGVDFDIYNWKNGVNYLGFDGTPVEFITDWSIGGSDKAKATELKELLLAHRLGPHRLPTVPKEGLTKITDALKDDYITYCKVVELLGIER